MKHLKIAAVPALALSLAAASLVGVVMAPAAHADGHGDVEAGKAKAAVCAACHGADGKGVTPDWPNLAGQVPGYIASQLKAFKSKERDNAVMYPQAQNLSEQDMKNIDAYYASLAPIVGAVSEANAKDAKKGEKLYRGGAQDTQIPACMACHGPAGAGLKSLYPRLSGQQAKYLETQLAAFKSGARQHSVMSPIAFKMTPAQMREVALYLSGL